MAKGIVIGGLNSGGSNIKSKQSGTVGITDLSQIDVAISPIDLSKSIVRVFFAGTGQITQLNYMMITVDFLTNSSIRIKRGASLGSYVQPIYWEVIEFNNVKSLQRGSLVMTTASQNVTCSPVDVSKSMLFYHQWSTSTDGLAKNVRLGNYLTSPTNILFEGYAPQTFAPNVDWQLIEFN